MKLKRKYILPILAVIFVLMQFFRIDKTNPPIDPEMDFISMMSPPKEVSTKIVDACYDCHSDNSKYPWYTNIAPVSWWIKGHINGGKKHLNFSTWAKYPKGKQEHKLEECVEVLEDKRMPLGSYTWMHPVAKMSDSDWKAMIEYFKSIQ